VEPWVQVHQYFQWDTAHLDAFKAKNADFQWELNRLGHEYWDYCPNWWSAYWTDLPDADDFWSEETGSPDQQTCIDIQDGDEEFEIKSHDPNALQANRSYSVWAEFMRDLPELGNPLPYQTEAEWCSKAGPFCDWGNGFGWGWGALTSGQFSNP
ncbi:MAG: hypothetical protein ACRD4B_01010, partial [Acidobacteriota bacterium]